MNETLLAIAVISLLSYGINLLLDLNYDRPLSAHLTSGSIAIISTWESIPVLSTILLIIFILYSGITLACYIEELKHKRNVNNYRFGKKIR